MRKVSFVPLHGMVAQHRWFSSSAVLLSASLFDVDHYKRLEVHFSATDDELKQAYRRKALQCHPDVHPKESKAAAEAEFRRISESYEFLLDAKRREKYNIQRGFVEAPKTAPTSQQPVLRRKNKFEPAKYKPVPLKDRTWRQSMVKGQAEKVFQSAFDGRSLEEVMFEARLREQRRAREERRKAEATEVPRSEDTVSSGTDSSVDAEQSNFGQQAPPQYARRWVAPSRREPPSTHMPFKPFVNMKVPAGITFEETIPTKPIATVAPAASKKHSADSDAPIEHVDVSQVADQTQRLSRYFRPWDSAVNTPRADMKERERMYPHNMGVLWSWQRPY
jgi:curved DNA-binding protein CbpA